MSAIQVNIDTLNTSATALKVAGESFTELPLNSVDTQSTISFVQNAIHTHEEANGNHLLVGEYLMISADLIMDIGERFFEMDASAASKIGIKS